MPAHAESRSAWYSTPRSRRSRMPNATHTARSPDTKISIRAPWPKASIRTVWSKANRAGSSNWVAETAAAAVSAMAAAAAESRRASSPARNTPTVRSTHAVTSRMISGAIAENEIGIGIAEVMRSGP